MLQRRFIINAIRTKRIFIQKMNKYTYQQHSQQQHMKNISTRILGNNYVMNSNSNKNNYHYYNYHTTKAVFDKDDNNNNEDDTTTTANEGDDDDGELKKQETPPPTYDEHTPVDELLQLWEDARGEQDYVTSDAIRTFLLETHNIRAATYEQDKEKQFIQEKVNQYQMERAEYKRKKKLAIGSFRERVNQQLSIRKQRLDAQKSKKKVKKKVDLPWQQTENLQTCPSKIRRTTMPNTRHRTKSLSIQSKRRLIVQEEALNWITSEDDIDQPRVTITSIGQRAHKEPLAYETFSVGVTNKTPKTTFFDIANDFDLNMKIIDWQPDRNYVPNRTVLEQWKDNPNLQRLQELKSKGTLPPSNFGTWGNHTKPDHMTEEAWLKEKPWLSKIGKEVVDRSAASTNNNNNNNNNNNDEFEIRYTYDFNDPYDLMEFVEDKIPGVITVRVRGGYKKVSRVAGVFHFMEEINRLTKTSREDFAQNTSMEDLRKLVLDSVLEIKRLRERHENLSPGDVSDADLILAREMDKRLKTLFDLLKNSRWEYNDIFEELNELVEVIEVLDNEPSLVDMKITRQQQANRFNQGGKGGNNKKNKKAEGGGGGFNKRGNRFPGNFKRTFGEDSPTRRR